MSLVKEARLVLKAEGFDRAEVAARNIGTNLDHAQRRADGLAASTSRIGSSLSAIGAGLNVAAGATGNDTIGAAARVFSAGVQGLRAGPWGAAALAGLQLGAEVMGSMNQPKVEVRNEIKIDIAAADDAGRRAGEAAQRAVNEVMRRRLFEMESAFGDMTRGAREASTIRLPR